MKSTNYLVNNQKFFVGHVRTCQRTATRMFFVMIIHVSFYQWLTVILPLITSTPILLTDTCKRMPTFVLRVSMLINLLMLHQGQHTYKYFWSMLLLFTSVFMFVHLYASLQVSDPRLTELAFVLLLQSGYWMMIDSPNNGAQLIGVD